MECKKKGLFGCREWQQVVEYYDLTDEAVRHKLINMGFKVAVQEKIQP